MPELLNKEDSQIRMKELKEDLFHSVLKRSITNKIWIGFLIFIILIGCYAYFLQLRDGLIVTAMRDYTSWGIYISDFVFYVAVSLVGSLMSSILRLSNAKWSTPLTRISEIIAVSAIMCAASIIIIDMGRPDRFLNVIFYGRIQSPIIWDVLVIITYLSISILLLYLPLIPDIAICRDYLVNVPKWQRKMYKILALGWKGNSEQYKVVNKSINILVVLIVPVAFAIHTVTSWLFATTWRPGWDSTNFGPYFVSGAFMLGAALVIFAMYVLRKSYHLEKYFTDKHFDYMGKLLVLLSLVYLYFNINEYLVPGYKMKALDGEHILELFTGSYSYAYWFVQIFGMMLPIVVLIFKAGRKPLPMLIMSSFVIIGAWLKRFLIVIPSLGHTNLPIQDVQELYHHYFPTWVEWAINFGSMAAVLLAITIFIRLFPIIPIWEIAEERGIHNELIHDNNA